MNGIGDFSIKIGNLIISFIKLQFFWLVSSVKRGLIFGIFPSTASVIDYYFKLQEKKQVNLTYQTIESKTQEYFQQANSIGFVNLLILTVIYVDLRISHFLIKNSFIHIGVITISIILLQIIIYTFPAMIRYNLNFKQIYQQAFYIAIASFPQTIAIIISLVITLYLSVLFILLSFIPMAIFLYPLSFFSLQAMQRIEQANIKK